MNRSEISFDSPLLLVTNEDDEDDNTGPNYGYYKSEKILGKLFRAIDEKRIWRDDIRDPAAEAAGPPRLSLEAWSSLPLAFLFLPFIGPPLSPADRGPDDTAAFKLAKSSLQYCV